MDRLITINIRDRYGRPLPGADVAVYVEEDLFATVKSSEGKAQVQIPEPRCPVRLVPSYQGQTLEPVNLALENDTWTFTFDVTGGYSPMARTIFQAALGIATIVVLVVVAFYLGLLTGLLPLALGSILLLVALILAFTFHQPSALQAQLLRSTFALGAGGLASQIPGLINVKLSASNNLLVTASGAIAIYIVTFFFVPAGNKEASGDKPH